MKIGKANRIVVSVFALFDKEYHSHYQSKNTKITETVRWYEIEGSGDVKFIEQYLNALL